MEFVPKTEKEIAESRLWPAGIYDFEIVEKVSFGPGSTIHTEDTTSKKGNQMMVLVARVYNDTGNNITITDYITDTMDFKLRHSADACGILDKYETGKLSAHDYIGCKGQVKIGTQKDKSGQYSDKNCILDYVKKDESRDIEKTAALMQDDDVPF